jgi:uncharacterized membrane protein YqjE
MANGNRSVSTLESARRLGATALDIVETRLSLFSTDLQDAARHVIWSILRGVIGVFFLGLGLLLITLFIVAFYWDTHRLAALGISGGVFLATSLLIVAMIIRSARQHRNPFAATLGELAKDRHHLEIAP